MKTEKSVDESASGAQRRAITLSKWITAKLTNVEYADTIRAKEILHELRGNVSELCQRIHEFNAYYNTLTTD